MQISPGWPSGTSLPSSSRSIDLGRRDRQADRAVVRRQVERIDRRRRRGLGQPVGLDQRHAGDLLPLVGDRLLHRHAAAQRRAAASRSRACANSGLLTSALNSVLTPVIAVNLYLRHLLDEAGDVARVRDQHVLGAERHEREAVRRQREDVIERQRRDDDLALVRGRGTAASTPAPAAGWRRCSGAAASRPSPRPSCRRCTAGTRCRRAPSGTVSSLRLRPSRERVGQADRAAAASTPGSSSSRGAARSRR